MILAYVFEGARGDCTNCPCDCKNYDNCPLIELDSTEEKDGYYNDEEYKISTLIRDAVFDDGDKSSVIGHYSHKAREIVEEARLGERAKALHEQMALEDNMRISAEEIRADERAKVLKAVIDCGWHCEVHSDKALYDMVEDELKEDAECKE